MDIAESTFHQEAREHNNIQFPLNRIKTPAIVHIVDKYSPNNVFLTCWKLIVNILLHKNSMRFVRLMQTGTEAKFSFSESA